MGSYYLMGRVSLWDDEKVQIVVIVAQHCECT